MKDGVVVWLFSELSCALSIQKNDGDLHPTQNRSSIYRAIYYGRDSMYLSQYKTSGKMIRLSNALIWFRNQELQKHDLTSSQFEVLRYLLTHRDQSTTAGTLMK